MLVDPVTFSLASKIEIVLCSVDAGPCGVVLDVVSVGDLEMETVPCGVVLVVVFVGEVEMETVSCGEVLAVEPGKVVEVEIIPCGEVRVVQCCYREFYIIILSYPTFSLLHPILQINSILIYPTYTIISCTINIYG